MDVPRGLVTGQVQGRRKGGGPADNLECERRELNPHPFRDRILSPARLPIPPRSRRP